MYERTGILSRLRISAPQCGQADRGVETDRPSGSRDATTFRKLPTASAGAKTTAATARFTLLPIGSGGAGLKEAPATRTAQPAARRQRARARAGPRARARARARQPARGPALPATGA